MTVIYNNEETIIPENVHTIQDLAKWKEIPQQGSAIALNNKLVKRTQWEKTFLNNFDKITVIIAAFGG